MQFELESRSPSPQGSSGRPVAGVIMLDMNEDFLLRAGSDAGSESFLQRPRPVGHRRQGLFALN